METPGRIAVEVTLVRTSGGIDEVGCLARCLVTCPDFENARSTSVGHHHPGQFHEESSWTNRSLRVLLAARRDHMPAHREADGERRVHGEQRCATDALFISGRQATRRPPIIDKPR